MVALENQFPLLTLLVPELPDSSFSAQSWNTAEQVPEVGIRLYTTNNVPMIKPNGEEYLLEAKYIPGFPVIAIKDNERLLSSKSPGYDKLKSKRTLRSKSGLAFKFTDDAFDRSLKAAARTVPIISPLGIPDPKIIDAFNLYKNIDGWHRDYIYYDLTPNSPRGSFKYNFQEYITSFKMDGTNGNTAFNRIADQTGDPTAPQTSIFSPEIGEKTGWADGAFEFRLNVLVNARNGIGDVIVKGFFAQPYELFVLNYQAYRPFPFGSSINRFYVLSSITPREMSVGVQLIKWDLNQYSPSIKIKAEEVDDPELISRSQTVTSQFATNFSIELEGAASVLKKIGLKFGGSREETRTSTFDYSITKVSDQLGDATVNFGDATVNFGDAIIVSISPPPVAPYSFPFNIANTSSFSSGIYSISVEPIRVQ